MACLPSVQTCLEVLGIDHINNTVPKSEGAQILTAFEPCWACSSVHAGPGLSDSPPCKIFQDLLRMVPELNPYSIHGLGARTDLSFEW